MIMLIFKHTCIQISLLLLVRCNGPTGCKPPAKMQFHAHKLTEYNSRKPLSIKQLKGAQTLYIMPLSF